jgi:hypothetical protein
MDRYKTEFLCYFFEFAPFFKFLNRKNKKIKVSNSREFCINSRQRMQLHLQQMLKSRV